MALPSVVTAFCLGAVVASVGMARYASDHFKSIAENADADAAFDREKAYVDGVRDAKFLFSNEKVNQVGLDATINKLCEQYKARFPAAPQMSAGYIMLCPK